MQPEALWWWSGLRWLVGFCGNFAAA